MDDSDLTPDDASIRGTVSGGPMDGCTFALPAIPGVNGACLSVHVNGEWHVHSLVPGAETNTLAHRGTDPGPWTKLPDPS